MSAGSSLARAPRGALVAFFVAACAALPIALLAQGWEREGARRAAVLEPAKGRLLLRTYGKPVAAALAPCPPESVYFAVFSLLITPVAALAIAARHRSDQRGGRRGAARDTALAAGIAASVLAAMYAVAAARLALAGTAETRSLLVVWAPRLWLANLVYALPYVILAAALRGMCRGQGTAAAAYGVVASSLAVTHSLLRLQGSPLAGFLPSAVDGLMLAGGRSSLHGAGVATSWALVIFGAHAFGIRFRTEEEAR